MAFELFSQTLKWIDGYPKAETLTSEPTTAMLSRQQDAEGYPVDEMFLPVPPRHSMLPAYRYRSSWGHYYNSFATSLAQLESFRVSFYDPDPNLPDNIMVYSNKDRYLCYDDGEWYGSEGLVMELILSEEMSCAERRRTDEEALKSLLDVVAKRRTTKT